MKKVSPQLLKATELPFLNLVFQLFQQMPLDLRELVCNECGWSVPTYYRKLRIISDGKGKISNAELEKICRVAIIVLQGSIEEIGKTSIGIAVSRHENI